LWIEQLAQRSNLRLDRGTSSPKPQRDSHLMKYTYTAALSGEYRDIRRFIHALEVAPEFLVLENVELAQGEGESKGIRLSVQIATYFRTHRDNGA
jgi:Tfp pilus assembly protein PilO